MGKKKSESRYLVSNEMVILDKLCSNLTSAVQYILKRSIVCGRGRGRGNGRVLLVAAPVIIIIIYKDWQTFF